VITLLNQSLVGFISARPVSRGGDGPLG